MNNHPINPKTIVRRSKLYIPINRENFVEKAWTRDADCIILDLEDSIAPNDKTTARGMVRDVIPIVSKGGAEIQVRINRESEEEDLEAAVIPGLTGLMIPKCETVESIVRLDHLTSQLEKERGLPEGRIQFDLIFETAKGIINADRIALASPRIVAMTTGQADLSVDLGFIRLNELNFEQYFYAENRVLYAARAANVQPHGLGAQKNVDFTGISTEPESMRKSCRHAFCLGYMGTSLIHPKWVKAANDGFTPTPDEINFARRLKALLEDAYANGHGSVSLDGRMYDVAHMKHVDHIITRVEAIERCEAAKSAAMKSVEKTLRS